MFSVPPPVSDGYPFVGKWFQINRSFLLARVKQEIEKGNLPDENGCYHYTAERNEPECLEARIAKLIREMV